MQIDRAGGAGGDVQLVVVNRVQAGIAGGLGCLEEGPSIGRPQLVDGLHARLRVHERLGGPAHCLLARMAPCCSTGGMGMTDGSRVTGPAGQSVAMDPVVAAKAPAAKAMNAKTEVAVFIVAIAGER